MKKIIAFFCVCLLFHSNMFALPPSSTISSSVNLSGVIFNCTINSGGIATLTGNYTVVSTLTVNSGGILNLNNFTLTAGAVIINNGGIIYEAGNTSGTSKLTSTAGIVYHRTEGHTDYSYISSPFVSSTGALVIIMMKQAELMETIKQAGKPLLVILRLEKGMPLLA